MANSCSRAAFGGPDVRCTDYAPFGTKELSDLAVAGLAGRNGVLLGNHGMIATGETLDQALWRAGELETLARMYYLAIAVGKPAPTSRANVGPDSTATARSDPSTSCAI